MPINPKIISRSIRNAAFGLEVRLNRLLMREFVPPHEHTLAIETSSLCNLKCRFCAYDKKQGPRLSMTDAFFIDCVTQALDMGYREFNLTPALAISSWTGTSSTRWRFWTAIPGSRAMVSSPT